MCSSAGCHLAPFFNLKLAVVPGDSPHSSPAPGGSFPPVLPEHEVP